MHPETGPERRIGRTDQLRMAQDQPKNHMFMSTKARGLR